MTMARILALAVIPAFLLGGVATAADKAAALPLALGASMPMTGEKMKNIDGKEITLDSIRGSKGTLVVFTCNACPWAKAWEDRIVALGNEYQKKGVGVIAINSNDPAVVAEDAYDPMKTRAREKGFSFPYVVDATSGVARAFGATRTPEAFLFDAKGALVYHGTIDDNAQEPTKVKERYLADALNSVAGGSEVAVKETKALGCGIKFRS
jgi:glutathione peroxidase-family protein